MSDDDEDRVAALRTKLVEMRNQLIRQLSFEVEGGSLALLSSVAGAISALDQMDEEVIAH